MSIPWQNTHKMMKFVIYAQKRWSLLKLKIDLVGLNHKFST